MLDIGCKCCIKLWWNVTPLFLIFHRSSKWYKSRYDDRFYINEFQYALGPHHEEQVGKVTFLHQEMWPISCIFMLFPIAKSYFKPLDSCYICLKPYSTICKFINVFSCNIHACKSPNCGKIKFCLPFNTIHGQQKHKIKWEQGWVKIPQEFVSNTNPPNPNFVVFVFLFNSFVKYMSLTKIKSIKGDQIWFKWISTQNAVK